MMTTTMPMIIGSSQKMRTIMAEDSKDPAAAKEVKVVKEVKARNLPVKMAAGLHVPMVQFSTEKV